MGLWVAGVFGVADADGALGRECISISAISGGHNAIEHIDPLADGGDDVTREADAHEVTRFIGRKDGRCVSQHLFHGFEPLADGEAADGVAEEIHVDQLGSAIFAQGLIRAALDDAEEGLIVWASVGLEALVGPPQGAVDGELLVFDRFLGIGAFIEGHDDVVPPRSFWICIERCGVSVTMSPLTWLLKVTPVSSIWLMSAREKT